VNSSQVPELLFACPFLRNFVYKPSNRLNVFPEKLNLRHNLREFFDSFIQILFMGAGVKGHDAISLRRDFECFWSRLLQRRRSQVWKEAATSLTRPENDGANRGRPFSLRSQCVF